MANSITNLIKTVSGNIADLRSNTYLTNSNNRRELIKLRNDIYKSIDDINNRSYESTGLNSVSTMYTRLINTMKDPTLPKSFDDIFNNDGLMTALSSTYMQNKPIYDFDKEIDLICYYMPKLQEALDTKKDHVLSPDHFNKEFLKIQRDSDFSLDATNDESIFNKDIKIMKDKYKLEEFIEESYDKVSKYGEDFVYHVPYSKAIDKLLIDRDKYGVTTSNLLSNLSANITESGDVVIKCIGESMDGSSISSMQTISDFKSSITNKDNSLGLKLNVEICQNPYLESLIKDAKFVNMNIDKINNRSLVREATEELQHTIDDGINGVAGGKNIGTKESLKLRPFDRILDKEIEVDKSYNDGLVEIGKKRDSNTKLNIKGCILNSIPRHRVIPIYIDNINMGFYYFEFEENDEYVDMTNVNNMFGNKTAQIKTTDTNIKTQDEILKSIAGAISINLDRTFINNNQDLSKEIYSILKYNNLYNLNNSEAKMRVTYIPPEDMTHCYFKKDEITNRGISDLAKALIPAKLWVCLNLTYILGNMTRGQDKRVYYVKQTVDTNISQSLLTTIDQIKRSNFNVRQIENINNILNIIGRYNDYVIPVSQSGDSPIQFEVMPGQDIQPPTEIMDKLEESAINSTDVPMDVINARLSMDFAVHYTMSNTRFLRKVIKRQAICEEARMYSGILTTVYNLEYNKHEVLRLVLPMPLFLDVSNTSQIIQNVNDLSTSIAETFLADEEDENIKAIFIKKVKIEYLSTYINIPKMQEYLNEAKIEAVANKIKTQSEE